MDCPECTPVLVKVRGTIELVGAAKPGVGRWARKGCGEGKVGDGEVGTQLEVGAYTRNLELLLGIQRTYWVLKTSAH